MGLHPHSHPRLKEHCTGIARMAAESKSVYATGRANSRASRMFRPHGKQWLAQRRISHSAAATGNVAYTAALPPRLKRGMEKLTGVNLDGVRVHYNSPLPARVQAHAYAQGEDIFLAPGQEHHLPHELGHVAQQALGLVKPTTSVNGVPVNDDPKLEQQATDWGERAVGLG